MKLVSVYIENFGGLSRFSLDFAAGLTTINQPNGFGKTTLAEFIRAMFYGFPRKSKTLEKSLRRKYAPWGGGQYGGNLVFSHEGQIFRLERTFGATPKEDTFTLIDLSANRKSNRFSSEIGLELFGLDSDSFERSVYLPQLQLDGHLSTASIQAKLSNLVEDSGDVGNYDKAMAALRNKRSALIPYRGGGGAVAENAAEISRLHLQLDHAILQKARLAQAQAEAERIQAQILDHQTALENVRQQLRNASETAAAAAQKRQYENLLNQQRDLDWQIEQYENMYPAGIPDDSSLRKAEEIADRWAVLTAQSAGNGCIPLPAMEEIAACRRKWEEYGTIQGKVQNLRLSAEKLMMEETLRAGTGSPMGMILAWAVGILGLLAGAALMAAGEFLYGGIGLGVGIAAATAAAALLLIRRKKQRARQRELDTRRNALHDEISALQGRCEQYLRETARFLQPYWPDAAPRQFFACLLRLEQESKLAVEARKHADAAAACRGELEAFFGQFGLVVEQDVRQQLRSLREDARDYRTALVQKETLARQIAAFREESRDVLSLVIPKSTDMQQLRQEEQGLRSALQDLTQLLLQAQQNVQTLQTEADRIGQLQEELARRQQKLEKDRENARILDDTMDFLQRARESLATSYMGTIRSRFGHYLARLGSADETCLIDADLQVQPERMGQARELAYFSAGQTDLVMLCMRLALVDALFKGQETFVILDDPFVNLDDVHMAQAAKMLRALAAQRQILYLTCHSSRTL